MQTDRPQTADEIRSAIRSLPATHENLKTLIAAVAAYAAGEGHVGVSDMDVVSEHLDAASDACEGCFLMTADEREAA